MSSKQREAGRRSNSTKGRPRLTFLAGLGGLLAIASVFLPWYQFQGLSFSLVQLTGTPEVSVTSTQTMVSTAFSTGTLTATCFFCVPGYVTSTVYNTFTTSSVVSFSTAELPSVVPLSFTLLGGLFGIAAPLARRRSKNASFSAGALSLVFITLAVLIVLPHGITMGLLADVVSAILVIAHVAEQLVLR